MHIPTVYSEEYDGSDSFVLNQVKLHHLVKVLRLKEGDSAKISNGRGLVATGTFNGNNQIILENIEEHKRSNTINFFLSAMDSGNRMRFAIEKLSEIGISSITVGRTLRSGKKNFELSKIKIWAESAVEQSGNPFIPEVYKIEKLDYDQFPECIDVCGTIEFQKFTSNNLAIGPEGGWDSSELSQFKSSYLMNFATLRSETAAIVAATLLLSA
tara:strand:+ start:41 stop:679 length:639 start_codon:yes stop_codon:yes gene_type:complete